MTTAVLVHGAWHAAWCWDHLVVELDAAGVAHRSLDLPLTGHSDDIAAVAALLDEVDGSKVLVGHSYGGLVISGAAAGRTDIDHLVYVCAFMVDVGKTVLDELADIDPPKLFGALRTADDGRSYVDPDGAIAAFYAESPPDLAAAAVQRLRPMDPRSTTHVSSGAPWEEMPSTYILCERDEAIPAAAQRRMAARAGTVVSLDTDHSPFLSRVRDTAQVIVDVAAGVGR